MLWTIHYNRSDDFFEAFNDSFIENGYGRTENNSGHVATQTSNPEVVVEIVHENPAAVDEQEPEKLPIETEVSKCDNILFRF